MRIRVLLSVLLLCAVAIGPLGAQERDFSYGDTILFPRIAIDEMDPDRLARCDYLVRDRNSRIWFGYVLSIPAPFGDGDHAFTLTDGQMGLTIGADFDVTFTPELGTCEAPSPSDTRFHGPGDELGLVPADTRYAIVTMRSVDTPGATFFLQIAGGS